MRKLTYHVATTFDGFIARPDGTVPGFTTQGEHVDDYQAALGDYDTVVMGKATYEFGYAYGMKPGDRPYAPMRHYIFSKSMEFAGNDEVIVIRDDPLATIDALKAEDGKDIYLCGGGAFAGFLLQAGRIDRVILKMSPFAYGDGIPLFAGAPGLHEFTLEDVKSYPAGVVRLSYALAR